MTLLRTQNLSVSMGKKILCHGLNLSVTAGETWGILGPNGSGKTTILHALAGLHRDFSGEIFLADGNLKQLSSKSVARFLAILFQDFPTIFSQTAWDFCAASRFPHIKYFEKNTAADEKIISEALQKMELDALKFRAVSQLSGGEKRRLALAATLAQTPKMYLLDEPTNHLDVRHQMQMLAHFRELAREKSAAIMMSLHDVNHAQQFCDKVILLFPDGKIVQGPTHEVLTSDNLSRMYGCEMTKNPGWYAQHYLML